MTIQELYKWALENNAEDCDIVLCDRDTNEICEIYNTTKDVTSNKVILITEKTDKENQRWNK